MEPFSSPSSSSSSSSLWDFVRWNSIWPLPHVLLAYHAYMYSRSCLGVLCTYYIVKVVQLFLFAMFSLNHEHFFLEILGRDGEGGPLRDAGCSVDFNGLFIGGTIQTFLGIAMGAAHAHVCSPSFHNPKYFNPITFWKNPLDKHDGAFHAAKKEQEESLNVRNIIARYGLWPPSAIFGWYYFDTATEQRHGFRENRHADRDDLDIATSPKPGTVSPLRRWAFRFYFWKRWLQLLSLGTPALLFYTVDSKRSLLRAGSVFYGLVTCCFLVLYKQVNQNDYFAWLERKYKIFEPESSQTVDLRKSLREIISNCYDSYYALWIGTCIFTIMFQSIPGMTSFYKVIISSVIVIVTSLGAYYAFRFIEKKRSIAIPGDGRMSI